MAIRSWLAALSATVLFASASLANDTLRLGGVIDGGTDTELVRWRGGYGGYGGGYRGGWGGYNGGWGGRYYSPGFSFSYSRPYYNSWGYSPRWYGHSSYYRPYAYNYYRTPTYYYAPSYYYYPGVSYYYSPCVSEGDEVPTVTLGRPTPLNSTVSSNRIFPSTNARANTFDYNGGPRSVVPMPHQRDPEPAAEPARPQVPVEGRFVSLPRESSGGVSPVGAETVFVSLSPERSAPAPESPRPTKSRYSYPAYGEQPAR